MTSSRRLTAGLAIITGLISTQACLDSLEPTPQSNVVSITLPRSFAVAEASSTGYTIFFTMFVRNKGTRDVYADSFYRRTEKLVNQKWEMAAETPSGPIGFRTTIGPGQTVPLAYVVTYTAASHFTLLRHPRGLYRVRIDLSYAAGGQDPLPPEDSYSPPFTVITE